MISPIARRPRGATVLAMQIPEARIPVPSAPGGATAEPRQSLHGRLTLPGDPDNDTARRVWNGAIDRRPEIIARCAGSSHVVEAVRLARSERRKSAPPTGPADTCSATPGPVAAGCCSRVERSSDPGRAFGGSRERGHALPRVLYRPNPALACIIGARREWTVEMISSEEIPCR